ncbi:MAG TPA: PIG-L family deacetylase [Terrimesophilobacter sp.]|nr:PIG-L family deacetylase [Terrimesophilobacter sp.]
MTQAPPVEPSQHERILFVHAHPDDETLATGGTIATLIDSGAHVTLLTLTRGEHGETIPADLAHLAGDPEALGSHRERELADAAEALGIRDHRILGNDNARLAGRAPRRYRDSGMVWVGDETADAYAGPRDEVDPHSLLAADYGELVTDVATVVADVKPTAIVSYDAHGGYGHPDHILAHDAASHAAEVLGVPYFAIVEPHPEPENAGTIIRVDVSKVLDRKRAALRAHRSQLTLDGDTITHPGGQQHELATVERFMRQHTAPLAPTSPPGIATKVISIALTALAGALIGALGTLTHQLGSEAGDAIGIGVVLALLLVILALSGLRLITRTRTLAATAGIALVAVVAAMASYSPGGSVIVPANSAGIVWAYGVPIVAAIIIGWPRIQRYDGQTTKKGRASP